MATVMTNSAHLRYRGGSSNKEYHLYMLQHSEPGKASYYTVHSEYGRAGRPLSQHDDKTKSPWGLSAAAAASLFDKVLSEKVRKGYQSDGRGPRPHTWTPPSAPEPRSPVAPAPASPEAPDWADAASAKLMDAIVERRDNDPAFCEAETELGTWYKELTATPQGRGLAGILADYAVNAQDGLADALEWCDSNGRAGPLLEGLSSGMKLSLAAASGGASPKLLQAMAKEARFPRH